MQLKKTAIAIGLLMAAQSSYAARMGELTVKSGIGLPLLAEIELLNVRDDEIGLMRSTMATPEEYASLGKEYASIHRDIKVQVTKKENGNYIIKLTSVKPVADGNLNVILRFDSKSGMASNMYTLNMPSVIKTETSVSEVAKTSAEVNAIDLGVVPASVSKPPQALSTKTDAPGLVPAIAPAQTPASNMQQAPAMGQPGIPAVTRKTKSGDTLNKIANEIKPAEVSLERMLVGLYKNNLDAFVNKNMNLLKSGKVLTTPNKEQLDGITQKAANREVVVHAKNWKTYTNQVVNTTPEVKPNGENKNVTVVNPEPINKTGQPVEGVDQVKIQTTKADVGSPVEMQTSELAEELAASQLAAEESKERVNILEGQLSEIKSLVSLKDMELEQANKKLVVAEKTSGIKALINDQTTQVVVGIIALLSLVVGVTLGKIVRRKKRASTEFVADDVFPLEDQIEDSYETTDVQDEIATNEKNSVFGKLKKSFGTEKK